VVCNTGVSLIPTIDGEFLRFTNAGLYDALFVMQDTKTLSLWNHITGEAMYGEMAGRELEVSGGLQQMTVAQALGIDPDMPIAISGRPFTNSGPGFTPTSLGRGGRGEGAAPSAGPGGPRGGGRGAAPAGRGGIPSGGPDPNAQLMAMFAETLGEEDTRRERMEMGLGIWSDDMSVRRFYPFDLVRERGALIDQVEGRDLLVYYDRTASVPAAVYVSAAVETVDNEEIRLANGQRVVAGQLTDSDGTVLPSETPNQVFTRWYGFSLTFPGPEIYEE
jgi:hypothetical protein